MKSDKYITKVPKFFPLKLIPQRTNLRVHKVRVKKQRPNSFLDNFAK